jgi:hypothetical protein
MEPLLHPLDMVEFAKFEEPSKKILRFLEKHLSNGKSDHVHNSTVSFGNCMLRVPGSFNSKYNNQINNQVRIIQRWNNQRLDMEPLLGDFLAYLLDEKNKKKSYSSYYRDGYNKSLSKT